MDAICTTIVVLGAGAWGTALAIRMAESLPHARVVLWARSTEAVSHMRSAGYNPYLPKAPLPEALELTDDLSCVTRADWLFLALPVSALAGVVRQVLPCLSTRPAYWVVLSKGIEPDTCRFPIDIVRDVLHEHGRLSDDVLYLSGPSFAAEVAHGLPVRLMLATPTCAVAERFILSLTIPAMRLIYTDDVFGLQVGGALKNILAVAAGVNDGLQLGVNARAALLSLGMQDVWTMASLRMARRSTIYGLGGLGDCLLTATSDLSRNRQVGLFLAEGRPLVEILATLGHVAEGVRAAPAIRRYAHMYDVHLPVVEAVNAILAQPEQARTILTSLLM